VCVCVCDVLLSGFGSLCLWYVYVCIHKNAQPQHARRMYVGVYLVCVCMCVECVCMYAYLHTHTYILVDSVRARVHTTHRAFEHTHTYKHTYIHTYEHTYTHTYIHTYIHTYTHMHSHRRGRAQVKHSSCCSRHKFSKSCVHRNPVY
jgi:hypothetical protein